jgi:hypothetical protein
MAIKWADYENEMSEVCSEEYAEPVSHYPRVRLTVNSRPEADPARPDQPFDPVTYRPEGIFEWQAKDVFVGKGREDSRAVPASHYSTRQPMLYIDKRAFDFMPRHGDRIVLEERQLTFEVQNVQPDGQGRIAVTLTQLGSHTP